MASTINFNPTVQYVPCSIKGVTGPQCLMENKELLVLLEDLMKQE